MIAQLGVAVVRPIVNWKIIFRLIAVLLSEKPECCDDLKSKIRSMEANTIMIND